MQNITKYRQRLPSEIVVINARVPPAQRSKLKKIFDSGRNSHIKVTHNTAMVKFLLRPPSGEIANADV